MTSASTLAPSSPTASSDIQVIDVAVVGASGYTGAELLRLICDHPHMKLTAVFGHSTAGKRIGDVFPSFAHLDFTLLAFDPDLVAKTADVAFLALPYGTAQDAADALLNRSVKVIDLSADHRFDDAAQYERVYGAEHAHPERLREAVYGLPELRREELRDAHFVACPGCYPTSVTLAVAPALNADVLASYEVIADCKSGVSGAGRSARVGSLFAERGESMQGYKTLDHRHAPEIEMNLNRLLTQLKSATDEIEPAVKNDMDKSKVWFSPHLVPMSRGILSTVYLRLKPSVTEDAVRDLYLQFYQHEPFVTLLSAGQHPTTLAVRGSNRCHLGITVRSDLLVVHAAIDNLGKGAAGQAVQCFNLIYGLEELSGLRSTGLYP
jgi:N-acetyl-gamma-glutamyl-phosphate reductase